MKRDDAGPRMLILSRKSLSDRPLNQWLEWSEATIVTTRAHYADDSSAYDKAFTRVVAVDQYTAWTTELEALHAARQTGADLVLSSSEDDVLRAARIRERLGLPGQSVDSARAFRDKFVMTETVSRAGLRTPAT